jgi:hypothetical protein
VIDFTRLQLPQLQRDASLSDREGGEDEMSDMDNSSSTNHSFKSGHVATEYSFKSTNIKTKALYGDAVHTHTEKLIQNLTLPSNGRSK